METPESINKENIPSSSEQHGALPKWSIEDIRNLTSLEGKKSFLLSPDQDRAKDWYQRYRQVLLTDTDALLACKNLVKKAQNSEVTDQAHLFVDNDYLQHIYDASYESGNTLRIELPKGQEIDIPLGMFVSAESFESWKGRPEGILKDGQNSSEVIEQYAGMESEPPPIEDLEGYLLPDGRVYFKSKNSHRVAAAIRRGDSHIKFAGNLSLAVLDIVPEKL